MRAGAGGEPGVRKPALIDRPAPGRGYVVLLLVLLLGTGLLAAASSGGLSEAGRLGQVAGSAFIVALVALPLIPLHAAIRTSYEFDGGTLRMRAGFVIRAEIDCGEIARAERVGFIPRVLGWGGGRGLANRLTDGLRITLDSGAVYYISPSDPPAFAERIRSHSGASGPLSRTAGEGGG